MNDGLLLQINRQRNLIPEPLLQEALAVQEQERAAGMEPRPLLDILATREDLSTSTVRIIKSLKERGAHDPLLDGNGNGEETVVDGFHAIVESVIRPPEPASPPSKTDWPKEVLAAEKEIKNVFGQFILVAQVGSGGSGTVYRAWDKRVRRYAGLKILHTMEPSALERFTREARIAGNLQHPAIATIYEVGEQDGRYYIAMKYIDGKPIDADPRSIPECLALIRDACRALDYAHKQGIIHRDVKPANLLVDSQDRVYVTDFGIAKQALHDQTSTLSMTGTIIGTPKYLPPEQARGEAKRADARSDVYSIGATLYTLLAGRAPFPSSNVWETLESVMKREPPPLTSLNGAVSPELERMVAKAMSKEPANRFASAGVLADELDRILQQRRYTGRYGLIRYLARKWVLVALVGVGMGALISWKAESFFPVEKAKEIEPKDAYRTAADKLMGIWDTYEDYQSNDKRTSQVKEVIEPIKQLLARQPGHTEGEVLLARADFLMGKPDSLFALKARDSKDYRVRYITSLIKLEEYLSKNPPLPSVMGPTEEWDGPIPPFPSDLTAEDFAIPTVTADLLNFEVPKDKAAAEGLEYLLKANHILARAKLNDYCFRSKPLPVFRRALHRATYLDGMWMETLRQGGEPWHGTALCRECVGAKLALALRGSNPIADLETLRTQCKLGTAEPLTDLLVLACIARLSVDRGLDPSAAFAAGEKIAVDKAELQRKDELRGVLRSAVLRWKALTGAASEGEFAKVQEELSDQSTTWMGRLARIESLLSLARVRRLHQGDTEAPLKEALKLTELLELDKPWEAAQVLRAEVYLRQGNPGKSYKEMPKSSGNAAWDLRANLILAEAHLGIAAKDESNRRGALDQAKVLAKSALNIVQDHPEALRLWGSALVESALDKAANEPAAAASDAELAVDYLSASLNRVPSFLEAQFDRARALFLVADYAAMSKSNATAFRLMAIKDLDSILERVKLAPATVIRGHLWELLTKTGDVRGLLK